MKKKLRKISFMRLIGRRQPAIEGWFLGILLATLMAIFIGGCIREPVRPTNPKFAYGDVVRVDVGPFYRDMCNTGKLIKHYSVVDFNSKTHHYYTLELNSECPFLTYEVTETELLKLNKGGRDETRECRDQ